MIDDAPTQIAIKKLTQKLKDHNIEVLKAYKERFSLEDVFIAIVEQARKKGKVAYEN